MPRAGPEIADQELRKRGVHVLTVYPGLVASALDRGARADYGNSWTRHLPSGKPQVLAARIVDAIDRRTPRIVYPKLDAIAARIPPLSRWIAAHFGPTPTK